MEMRFHRVYVTSLGEEVTVGKITHQKGIGVVLVLEDIKYPSTLRTFIFKIDGHYLENQPDLFLTGEIVGRTLRMFFESRPIVLFNPIAELIDEIEEAVRKSLSAKKAHTFEQICHRTPIANQWTN